MEINSIIHYRVVSWIKRNNLKVRNTATDYEYVAMPKNERETCYLFSNQMLDIELARLNKALGINLGKEILKVHDERHGKTLVQMSRSAWDASKLEEKCSPSILIRGITIPRRDFLYVEFYSPKIKMEHNYGGEKVTHCQTGIPLRGLDIKYL